METGRWIRRPSPALVVAMLALFVSLGGSAYAVTKINGKNIKRGTITGSKLRKNTLTGTQIKESKLGKVPSAVRADSAGTATSAATATTAASAASASVATHATSADSIGGLTAAQIQKAGTIVPFDARMNIDVPDQTLVQAGPFTVKGHCERSGGGQNFYQVYATSSTNDGAASSFDIFGTKKRDLDFDSGDQFVITQDQESGAPPDPSTLFPITAYLWSHGGTSVTLEMAQGGHLFGATEPARTQCVFSGFAVVQGTG
jgi:hypothetical protein